MLRTGESLHVRLTPGFGLSFKLARRTPTRVYWREQIVSEQKLLTAARMASRAEQVEQVATLIRFLQKMIDAETGEPSRVTCPRCGWLAVEKPDAAPARCFNCRAEFGVDEDY